MMERRLAMPIEDSILDAVRALRPAQQLELLTHVTRLMAETSPRRPYKSVKGLWADLNISLSAEDLEECRREMWKAVR
jgi:hypothetical protein